jgi:hypothetical protein
LRSSHTFFSTKGEAPLFPTEGCGPMLSEGNEEGAHTFSFSLPLALVPLVRFQEDGSLSQVNLLDLNWISDFGGRFILNGVIW